MINEIILAIIQGLTEFLPISSSGHLAIFSNFFSEVNISFYILMHFSSLLAVLLFLRKEIKKIFSENKKYLIYIVIGILPAGIFGFLFKDFIERTFSSLLYISIGFFLTSIFLFLTKIKIKEKKINLKNSFFVGIFQVLALFPGVSRSGITISSAKIFGIKNKESFNFSFLMFIPLVIGALFIDIYEAGFSLSLNFLVPFIICFFVSYLSLTFLNKILKKSNLWIFGIYCFLIGIFVLFKYFSLI